MKDVERNGNTLTFMNDIITLNSPSQTLRDHSMQTLKSAHALTAEELLVREGMRRDAMREFESFVVFMTESRIQDRDSRNVARKTQLKLFQDKYAGLEILKAYDRERRDRYRLKVAKYHDDRRMANEAASSGGLGSGVVDEDDATDRKRMNRR